MKQIQVNPVWYILLVAMAMTPSYSRLLACPIYYENGHIKKPAVTADQEDEVVVFDTIG